MTDDLSAVFFNSILHKKITKCIIMLGSNDNAKNAIDTAVQLLSNSFTLTILNDYISADHTGRSSNHYYNMAVVIDFKTPIIIDNLINILKKIETACGRDNQKNSELFGFLVAMDIDIMAVVFDNTDNWVIIKDRLPFKKHEVICINDYFAKSVIKVQHALSHNQQ